LSELSETDQRKGDGASSEVGDFGTSRRVLKPGESVEGFVVEESRRFGSGERDEVFGSEGKERLKKRGIKVVKSLFEKGKEHEDR